jgi:hypothetical protein
VVALLPIDHLVAACLEVVVYKYGRGGLGVVAWHWPT